jgi:hypothetical protein
MGPNLDNFEEDKQPEPESGMKVTGITFINYI